RRSAAPSSHPEFLEIRSSEFSALLHQQPFQRGQWYGALFQRALMELFKRKIAALLLLVMVTNLEPAFPTREVGGQLARRKLRPLQFRGGFFFLLIRIVDHEIECLLVRHSHRLKANVENGVR